MDAANADLKGFTERFYAELASAHLDAVKDTLSYLARETNVWLEITNLMIPGWNDSETETDAMTRWIVDELGPTVPVHFTAFHPDYKMLDTPPTPPATLRRARRIAMANGVRYAYTGNVKDPEGQSTYCHRCGALLIELDWYKLGAWAVTDDGRCDPCAEPLPGEFAGRPGRWGARRIPIIVSPRRA